MEGVDSRMLVDSEPGFRANEGMAFSLAAGVVSLLAWIVAALNGDTAAANSTATKLAEQGFQSIDDLRIVDEEDMWGDISDIPVPTKAKLRRALRKKLKVEDPAQQSGILGSTNRPEKQGCG